MQKLWYGLLNLVGWLCNFTLLVITFSIMEVIILAILGIEAVQKISATFEPNVVFVLVAIAVLIFASEALKNKWREQFAAVLIAVAALYAFDERFKLGLGFLSRLEDNEIRSFAAGIIVIVAAILVLSNLRNIIATRFTPSAARMPRTP